MDLTHLHLLLNHFPTIGTTLGLMLFVVALWTRNDHLKQAGLVVFFGIALLTIPTYVTGNAAQEAIAKLPGISTSLIQTHEGAAVIALALIEITGVFAWLGLWQYRRRARLPGWNATVILALALVSFVFVAGAANIGGEIRHSEIRPAQETTTAVGALARDIGSWVTSIPWAWPTSEALHFVGLTLLFGVVLLVDLRMLGMMKSIPFTTFHRLLPWAILGFAINGMTGMLFFFAAPGQYSTNPVFHWKLALILIAAVNGLYFTMFDQTWKVGAGDDAPSAAKLIAGSAILLWLGVIYCGTMLPFLGNAF